MNQYKPEKELKKGRATTVERKKIKRKPLDLNVGFVRAKEKLICRGYWSLVRICINFLILSYKNFSKISKYEQEKTQNEPLERTCIMHSVLCCSLISFRLVVLLYWAHTVFDANACVRHYACRHFSFFYSNFHILTNAWGKNAVMTMQVCSYSCSYALYKKPKHVQGRESL